MKKHLQILSVIILFTIAFSGCSHQMALQKQDLQKEQTITAQMNNGDKISGTVTDISEQTITVNTEQNTTRTLNKGQIQKLSGPQPYYDANNRIISEKEINAVKTNKKFWTYTLSGGLVSAGASFFLSSMIARSSNDDIEDPITISGTAAGTLIGGFLFSRWGKQKDKEVAVENIRLVRSSNNFSGIDAEKDKQEKIKKQLDRIQQERQEQDAEIKKLREKIKDKDDN